LPGNVGRRVLRRGQSEGNPQGRRGRSGRVKVAHRNERTAVNDHLGGLLLELLSRAGADCSSEERSALVSEGGRREVHAVKDEGREKDGKERKEQRPTGNDDTELVIVHGNLGTFRTVLRPPPRARSAVRGNGRQRSEGEEREAREGRTSCGSQRTSTLHAPVALWRVRKSCTYGERGLFEQEERKSAKRRMEEKKERTN
jgi:hypothetical protein